MKRVAVYLAAASALAPWAIQTPASAAAWNGACLLTLHVRFVSPIGLNSPPTSYTVEGSGTCAVSGLQLPAGVRTISIGGSGAGGTTRCAPLVIDGGYAVGFSPQPAPPPGNGVFNFWGSASGGAFTMLGTNPQFVGVGVAVGGGGAACASGGTDSLTFQIALPFADP